MLYCLYCRKLPICKNRQGGSVLSFLSSIPNSKRGRCMTPFANNATAIGRKDAVCVRLVSCLCLACVLLSPLLCHILILYLNRVSFSLYICYVWYFLPIFLVFFTNSLVFFTPPAFLINFCITTNHPAVSPCRCNCYIKGGKRINKGKGR